MSTGGVLLGAAAVVAVMHAGALLAGIIATARRANRR